MQHQTTNHAWKSFPNNLKSDADILLFAGLNDAHRINEISLLPLEVHMGKAISWLTDLP